MLIHAENMLANMLDLGGAAETCQLSISSGILSFIPDN